MRNLYFRGVAIGLTIAWVTSAIAYWVVAKRGKPNVKTTLPVSSQLMVFELILSVIFLAFSFLA